VSEVKSEKDEFFWSLNVKLGVLSMMEMNLEERRSMDSTDRLVQMKCVMGISLIDSSQYVFGG
jgi:hypothetical protein